MKKLNKILFAPMTVCALGFIVAATGDKDLGIKIFTLGFSLFILIMLIVTLFSPPKLVDSQSSLGSKISVIGFNVIGLPMAYYFWHSQEPPEIIWNIGAPIFVVGLLMNMYQNFKAS